MDNRDTHTHTLAQHKDSAYHWAVKGPVRWGGTKGRYKEAVQKRRYKSGGTKVAVQKWRYRRGSTKNVIVNVTGSTTHTTRAFQHLAVQLRTCHNKGSPPPPPPPATLHNRL